MARLYYISLVLLLSCLSCELLQLNLAKIEYSNFECESGIQVGFSPLYENEIIEIQGDRYVWAGTSNFSAGLLEYCISDSVFKYQGIRQGYSSNALLSDNDTVLVAFNEDSLVTLIQLNLEKVIIKESSNLFTYVNDKLGLVKDLTIHDMARYADSYVLVGEVIQTIGGSRTILLAVTRNLDPLWIRTYISDSFATNIEATPEGDLFVAGIRKGYNYIIKTNMKGDYFSVRDFTLLGRDSVSDMEYHNEALYFTSTFNQYPFKTRIVSFNRNLIENWFLDLSTIDTNHPVLEVNRMSNLVITYASYANIFLTELDSDGGAANWCNRFTQDVNYSPKALPLE